MSRVSTTIRIGPNDYQALLILLRFLAGEVDEEQLQNTLTLLHQELERFEGKNYMESSAQLGLESSSTTDITKAMAVGLLRVVR